MGDEITDPYCVNRTVGMEREREFLAGCLEVGKMTNRSVSLWGSNECLEGVGGRLAYRHTRPETLETSERPRDVPIATERISRLPQQNDVITARTDGRERMDCGRR